MTRRHLRLVRTDGHTYSAAACVECHPHPEHGGPCELREAHAHPALPLELTVLQLEALLRERGYLRHTCRLGGGVVLVSAETRDGRVHHADGRDLAEAVTRLICLGGRPEAAS